MPTTRLERLRDEFGTVRAAIDKIQGQPAGHDGDLSDEQDAQVAQLVIRATEIGTELEPLVARARSVEATASILASVGMARSASPVVHAPGPEVHDVSPGEYFASYCRAVQPGNPTMRQDLEAHVERFRTVATMTTADHSGIIPTPILGPIINFIDANRYVIPTLTNRPMPGTGATFLRPRITQHVAVSIQSAELAELTSQKFTTASDTVSKQTFGGSLQLSQQDIDWTDPSSLQMLFDDFSDIYAKTTDAAMASSLTAAVTSTVAWTATSVGTILTSIANAASSVYSAASMLPTDMWCDLGTGLTLGTLTTTTGDLVFPTIGIGRIDVTDQPGLGIGRPLGLNLHVCPNLAANTRIVGCARYGEVYEERKGFFQVYFPSALKVEVAYAGYLASLFKSQGFVKLV